MHIGATTTFSHITNSPIIPKIYSCFGRSSRSSWGPQVRNITGTIGGNICNGAVSADSAPHSVFLWMLN